MDQEQQEQLVAEVQRLINQKKVDDSTIKEMTERLNIAVTDLKQAR